MKTVFDYNPTNKELTSLFGTSGLTPDEIKNQSEETNAWDLCLLFNQRKDYVNMHRYLSKLSDQRRIDFERLRYHLLKG